MYIYMYIYIYIHIYVHIYVYIYVYMHCAADLKYAAVVHLDAVDAPKVHRLH